MGTVAVIGTGGNLKRGFLESLAALHSVIVIDAECSAPATYPDSVAHRLVPALTEQFLEKELDQLVRTCDLLAIGTIFEPCVEAAAWARDYLSGNHLVGGLTYEKALAFRDKRLMYEFLTSIAKVTVPRYVTFPWIEKQKNIDCPYDRAVLKPTRGFGNVGIRLISKGSVVTPLHDAMSDLLHHKYRSADFQPLGNEWIISEYVTGKEVEADLIVQKDGTVLLCAMHEKTIIRSYGPFIEENNSQIPPATLTSVEDDVVRRCCHRIAQAAATEMAKCNVEAFALYIELIVSNEVAYCLEIAARIGGGLLPFAYKRASGIDLFELAAQCTIGKIPRVVSAECHRAVYWQLIYAQNQGHFQSISGIESLSLDEVMSLATAGAPIEVPYSDSVAAVMFEDSTPMAVTRQARDKLQNLRVLITDLDNNLVECEVPVPPIPHST